MEKSSGALRRVGVGIAAVLMAVTGVVVSTGSASAATPLCVKMVPHGVGSGRTVEVPAADGSGSSTCHIGSGSAANTKIVIRFQQTMKTCYGSLYLASPYQSERIRDISADGSFGPRTHAALKAVQKSIGATVDGSYGPNTRDRMKFIDIDGQGCYSFRS